MQLKGRFKLFAGAVALLLVASLCITAAAQQTEQETRKKKEKCENQFPNLFKDICWKCMFPIRIGGKIIMDKDGMPDNVSEITGNPDDYNPDSYGCSCKSGKDTYYGIYISFWEPIRVMEVTRRPGCFGFLFGLDMNEVLQSPYGNKGPHPNNNLEKSFMHVHYIHAPLMEILGIAIGSDFCKDWMVSNLDLGYMTEVDPLWNNDELSAVVHVEGAVFSNFVAQALCIPDCVTSSFRYPINQLFWCAGCWGSIYPMTGNTGNPGSPISVSSLLMTRLLYRLARYPVPPAMELDTSSSMAKCQGVPWPVLKKSQYRINTLVPISESVSFHTIGASSVTWGEWRNIPAAGEDHTFVVWRKRNCCLKLDYYPRQ